MTKILCMGKATQDVFLLGKIFEPQCDDTACYAHMELGAKLDVEESYFSTGGNAMNAAITFARHDNDVKMITQLGDDPAGRYILRVMENERINSSGVHVIADAQTSHSTVLLSPNGERTILNFKGSQLDTSIYSIPEDKPEWLYLSSVNSFDRLIDVLRQASESDIKVAFNPGGTDLSEGSKLTEYLTNLYVFIANKEEYQLLFGEIDDVKELVRRAINSGVNFALLTDGPNGSYASDGEKFIKAGMYEDVPVKDRTGAGDSFASGFAASLASGRDLEASIVFASANSTSVVQHIGATTGILRNFDGLHDMPLQIEALN